MFSLIEALLLQTIRSIQQFPAHKDTKGGLQPANSPHMKAKLLVTQV